MTQETKLGLFVLVGIAALVVSIALLGDFQFQRNYSINILFSDIAGLPDKAKVKIAGVEVGAVKTITLEEGQAKVKVWIKQDVKVHRDARASISSTGIIGSQYLDLTIGSLDEPLLKNGDTIQGIQPMSLNKMAENVMKQVENITKIFSGSRGEAMGENIAATLANLRKVSDSLRVALADQEGKLVDIVDSIHSFTGDLAEITADNKEQLKTAINNISDTSAKLDRILARIENGDGTVGKLLSDKEMGNDLKETFSDLKETTKQAKRVVRRLNLIETKWDYTRRYDTRNNISRNDIGLRIYPNPTKYYYLGVSNVGDNVDASGDFEQLNTYDLQIGKIYGPVEAYAGVIRSNGGVGIKVKPFWKWNPLSRLEITAEGYRFSRTTPVGKPIISVGARAQVTDWAYVGARTEDLYYTSSLNVYANLVFRDDDIAYIMGLVGLARP
jgi:phospholipid/cholesterol/gamma-HCH transport system substrate-binding protein